MGASSMRRGMKRRSWFNGWPGGWESIGASSSLRFQRIEVGQQRSQSQARQRRAEVRGCSQRCKTRRVETRRPSGPSVDEATRTRKSRVASGKTGRTASMSTADLRNSQLAWETCATTGITSGGSTLFRKSSKASRRWSSPVAARSSPRSASATASLACQVSALKYGPLVSGRVPHHLVSHTASR